MTNNVSLLKEISWVELGVRKIFINLLSCTKWSWSCPCCIFGCIKCNDPSPPHICTSPPPLYQMEVPIKFHHQVSKLKLSIRFPWGDEAFDKAKSENKPIFLSGKWDSIVIHCTSDQIPFKKHSPDWKPFPPQQLKYVHFLMSDFWKFSGRRNDCHCLITSRYNMLWKNHFKRVCQKLDHCFRCHTCQKGVW